MYLAKCKLAIRKLHTDILLPEFEKQLDAVGSSADYTGF